MFVEVVSEVMFVQQENLNTLNQDINQNNYLNFSLLINTVRAITSP